MIYVEGTCSANRLYRRFFGVVDFFVAVFEALYRISCKPTLKQFTTDEGGVNRSQSLLFASHEQSYKQARNKLCNTDKLNIFFFLDFFFFT